MPAVTSSGCASVADCQPVAVSLANVTVASREPAADQIEPVWVPLLPTPLKKRIALTVPLRDGVKAMPSSSGAPSSAAAVSGTTSPRSVWFCSVSADRVRNVQLRVPRTAPSAVVTPARVTVTSAPAGIGADGVQVIRWRSVESTAVPARAPPAPTVSDQPGSTWSERSTTTLLARGTSSAPGAGDCEVIAMLGGVFSKTTSTM